MNDRIGTTKARQEGLYWVILGQNPPEIAYWERGEWCSSGSQAVAAEAVTVASDRLMFKPRLVQVFRVRPGMPERPALPLPDKPSLAVLPFQNMSGDPEQEYFADGTNATHRDGRSAQAAVVHRYQQEPERTQTPAPRLRESEQTAAT